MIQIDIFDDRNHSKFVVFIEGHPSRIFRYSEGSFSVVNEQARQYAFGASAGVAAAERRVAALLGTPPKVTESS